MQKSSVEAVQQMMEGNLGVEIPVERRMEVVETREALETFEDQKWDLTRSDLLSEYSPRRGIPY